MSELLLCATVCLMNCFKFQRITLPLSAINVNFGQASDSNSSLFVLHCAPSSRILRHEHTTTDLLRVDGIELELVASYVLAQCHVFGRVRGDGARSDR